MSMLSLLEAYALVTDDANTKPVDLPQGPQDYISLVDDDVKSQAIFYGPHTELKFFIILLRGR